MLLTDISFSEFIHNFENTLRHLFHEKEDINKLSLERGLPPGVLAEIMSDVPLSVAIPEQYGGRGAMVKECLGLLSAASYESLSLSLIFGINIALFLEPVAKYANEGVKADIFQRFLKKQHMGGLMITEPGYGSDALNMKTFNKEVEGGYKIKGTKHWQGLTGMADYWLIACRKESEEGELSRDIDFFICDTHQENQKVIVEEYYDNVGLYMIPYGLNKLDLQVPQNYKLEPESTGIKMMLDILHRSRMQFPGMGMGFIKRMLDDAVAHCTSRMVGAGSLLAMDQIQFQLSRIQTAYTICSAMCARSSEISGIDHNLATEGIEANSMKAVVTDLMQECANLFVQVSGANGYRISHVGGRGIMDSRPFQIFEGSNEMLYAQIAEAVTRQMKKQKEPDLYQFLSGFAPSANSCGYFRKDLSVQINGTLSQRKLVDLGRVIARVVCLGYVLDLQAKGFRKDLTDNCSAMMQQEISCLMSSFNAPNQVSVIEDYSDGSSWLQFV